MFFLYRVSQFCTLYCQTENLKRTIADIADKRFVRSKSVNFVHFTFKLKPKRLRANSVHLSELLPIGFPYPSSITIDHYIFAVVNFTASSWSLLPGTTIGVLNNFIQKVTEENLIFFEYLKILNNFKSISHKSK